MSRSRSGTTAWLRTSRRNDSLLRREPVPPRPATGSAEVGPRRSPLRTRRETPPQSPRAVSDATWCESWCPPVGLSSYRLRLLHIGTRKRALVRRDVVAIPVDFHVSPIGSTGPTIGHLLEDSRRFVVTRVGQKRPSQP